MKAISKLTSCSSVNVPSILRRYLLVDNNPTCLSVLVALLKIADIQI